MNRAAFSGRVGHRLPPLSGAQNAQLSLTDGAGQSYGFLQGIGAEASSDNRGTECGTSKDATHGAWRVRDVRIEWDGDARVLRLTRVPSSVSGLYYAIDDGIVSFADSLPELFALRGRAEPELDHHALVDMLLWGRVLPPYTPYPGVYSLAPGSALHIQLKDDSTRTTNVEAWNWADAVAANEARPLVDEFEPAADRVQLVVRYMADNPAARNLTSGTDGAPQPDTVFNHLPVAAAGSLLPVADIEEGAFAAALSDTRFAQAHFICDLAEATFDTADATASTVPAAGATHARLRHASMAVRGLRGQLADHAVHRTETLFKPVRALQQALPRDGLDLNALFRLIHVLPDRRLRLDAIAEAHGCRIGFECASTPRMVGRLRDAARGQSVRKTKTADLLIAGTPLTYGSSGANPYDHAIAQYQMRGEFKGAHVSRYFRLTPWAVRGYWKNRSMPIATETENRLIAILTMQYLLNHT